MHPRDFWRIFRSLGKQILKLPNSVVRDLNHPQKIRLRGIQVKKDGRAALSRDRGAAFQAFVFLRNPPSGTYSLKQEMDQIRLLPETVASQVAAGEVVERPASVAKELIENSIDAGAQKIDIVIRRGGISLVRVIDDGCGMDRDDALLSLERHATSKIRSADDLAAVTTLGFRGEALPSIASVARFRLTTRERRALAGTEIVVNGGRIETVRDAGEAPGSQIEVRSLFFNVPARRKFLRSEATETRHIEHEFFLHALSHPAIGFTFVRDDRFLLQLPV